MRHTSLRVLPVLAVSLLTFTACSPRHGSGLGEAGAAVVASTPPATTVPVTTIPAQTVPAATVPATTVAPTPVPEVGYVSAIVHEVVDGPAFDDVERRVTERITEAGLPGASLLVVQHGQLVEQEAWLGYDLDTVVPIASASKWMTAATIMTLVDDGVLALDAPISSYVPEITGTVGTITLRQLLSFTSGLVDDRRLACDGDPSSTLQTCAAEFLRAGVVHRPGAAFRYGSQHLLVAGAIAERVTGQPFAELFQQRIAEPLEMTHTWFMQAGDPKRPADQVDNPLPAGSAVSTLGDYARFVEMIAHDGMAPDGTQLLAPQTVAEMQHDQIGDAEYASASRFRMQLKTPYGLGEWLDEVDADGNATVVSSDGKFGFRPWIDTTNDLFGVYLVFDGGEGYVEGDPDATAADDANKVPTSGLWIFDWVAEALGATVS